MSGLIDSFLIKTFKNILDNHPEIRLNITFEDNPIDVSEQKFDILLRSGNITDDRTVARHLHNFEWVIVAHHDYIKRHGFPQNLSELEKLDWINYPNKGIKNCPSSLIEDEIPQHLCPTIALPVILLMRPKGYC
ncbi:putative transcriptional regulator [Actinobacillus equuli]|nr:putative transcriptional regulator [Actinobacillus equuli]